MLDPTIPADLYQQRAQRMQALALPAPSLMQGSMVPAGGSVALPMPTAPNVTAIPTQDQRDQSRLDYLKQSGDGISQIHNPLVRGVARGLDITGSVFGSLVPAIRAVQAVTPGTSLHHNIEVNRQAGLVAQDQARALQDAKLAETQAGTDNTVASTRLTNDKAAAAEAPPAPDGDPSKTVTTDSGILAFNPATQKYDTKVGDAVDKTSPETAAYQALIGKGVAPIDAFAQLNQAKNTKDASFQQQFLDGYRQAHPNVPITDAIAATIRATSTQPKIDIHNATASATGVPSSSPGQVSPLVQAIIDGRSPAPNSRSKAGMALMAQVTAADPSYDASRYNTYQAMQKEMTSGKTGGNINALNTLLNHVAEARTHLPDNGSFSPLNALENSTSTVFGNNPTGKFDTDAVGIGGEFGKLVSGGVATVDEQKHLQKLLDHNASPKILRDNLDEIEELAHGKLNGILSQVKSASHPGAGSNQPSSLPTAKSADPLGIR